MAEIDPQHASDYDDRTTAAVKSVLVEIGQILGSYLHIAEKFRDPDDFGPTSVRQFVDRPDMLEDRTADQWQHDAFGQVDTWLTALGMR